MRRPAGTIGAAAIALAVVAFGTWPARGSESQWQAGVAKVNITPKKFIWMSGYASRTKPAEGKLTDLWAKALALKTPDGKKFVLVTLDLVGIPRDLSVPVCRRIEKKFGLPRAAIILSTSHTHTGPVVRSNLNTMYNLSPEQRRLVKEYGDTLEDDIVKAVERAFQDLRPARLAWKIGTASFAVNRRNNPEREVPRLRKEGKLKGPVDHDVPVLAVYGAGKEFSKLRAVVFGYACHATVLSFYKWSGDYPGFAQIYLEQRHPGAVAMFWAGCGGDQNPLPRRKVTLAMKYGKELADAVDRCLECKMAPLPPRIAATYREIPLPFGPLPTREQLVKDSLSKNRYVAARAKTLLEALEKEGSLRKTYPYPVQVWRIGGRVTWVILGGEVVVDYSLRIKKMLGDGRTWVMAYANDVMAYIPSVRVLKEGGYEGKSSMIYYGQPTVWSPRIEEMIIAEVRRQATAVATEERRKGSPGR